MDLFWLKRVSVQCGHVQAQGTLFILIPSRTVLSKQLGGKLNQLSKQFLPHFAGLGLQIREAYNGHPSLLDLHPLTNVPRGKKPNIIAIKVGICNKN